MEFVDGTFDMVLDKATFDSIIVIIVSAYDLVWRKQHQEHQ
jgi:hypothetical protein